MSIRIVHLPIALLVGLLALQGCRPAGPKAPATGAGEAGEAATVGEAPAGGHAGEREVLEALRAAYALESRLWDRRERIRSREDVVEFFLTGFCEEPARRLADYYWLGPGAAGGGGAAEPRLRVGEPMLTLPDEVRVEEVGPDQARVRLDYPQQDAGPTVYPAQSFQVVLRRTEGGWRVCSIGSPDSGRP